MLKDTWVDKKDGVDINSAEDINQVAHAVIDLEKEAENKDETGIHIGPEAPTNGEQIWIDTDEESAEAGGTSIDVTAEVGQTIIVKEVDDNGKPTKWESAEYQPRTHYKTETVVLPETTGEVDAEMELVLLPDITLEAGKEYMVKYNGVEYVSTCFEFEPESGFVAIGNIPMLDETGDNGQPFVVGFEGEWFCLPLDGSTSVTLSIAQVEHTPIPIQYMTNAFPYYIEVEHQTTSSATDVEIYICHDTVENVKAIYKSGREIKVRMKDTGDNAVPYELLLNLFYVFYNEQYSVFNLGFSCSSLFSSMKNVLVHFVAQEDGTFSVSDSLGD